MSTAAIDATCIMNGPLPPQRTNHHQRRQRRQRRRPRSRAEASSRSCSAAGAGGSTTSSFFAGFADGGGNACNEGGGKAIEVTDDGAIGGRRPASAAGGPLLPLQLPLPLPLPLLIILMLALRPSPADATLYLHSTSSDGYAIQTPYPSEPARFGRVFDGLITGPANLFLPPWGVDSRLCSIDGISSRAEDGGAEGVEGGDGVRRLDDIMPLGRPSSSRRNSVPHGHGTRHRRRPHTSNHRRRLLDLLDDDDDTTTGGLDVNFGTGMDMEMDYVIETEAEMNGHYEGGEEDAQASLLHLRHRYLMASSSGDDGKDGAGYSTIGDSDQHQKQDRAKLKTIFRTAPKRRAANDGQRYPDNKHSHRDLHEQYGTNSRGGGNIHSNPSSGGDAAHSSPYSSSIRSSSLSGLDQPRPIALLVERGGCTFHEKAVNAMRLNRRLLREAVLLSRDGQERTDNGGSDGSDGDNGDRDDGTNRKRVYEFPDKGDAGMDGDGDGRRRRERKLTAHWTLQGDDADDADDAAADAATNTFDQDTIIEEGLDSVQRDMDKSEVGTARPSDLIGDGGAPLGGYGNNGSGSDNDNSNIFVELPTLRIDYLVVYNDEVNSAYGKEDDLVLMDRPSNTQDIDRVDVGLVFISRRSGLDLRRRMDELSSTEYGTTVPWPSGLTTDYNNGSEGDDEDDSPAYYITPRDLFPSTATEKGGWSLPISVDQKKELGPYSSTGWPRGSTPRDSFYWIRFVLIALLIVTPVMRGCFVWHGAGGRVQFRRNEAGRIVGLHIVRPSGSWITGWDDGPWEEGDAERQRNRIRKMTQDEVMNLPEIEYTVSPDDADEVDKNEDEEDLEGRDDTDKQDDKEDVADVNVVSSASQESQESETSATGDLSTNSPAPKTTCTSCSICIDDFETGEKIRLLPRCGHAFHTDCILPWLTERSGSCPLCKRNVMDDGTDGLEESSSDDENNDVNSIIGGESDSEEMTIENEDGDIEEGQAGSRHRAQDSRPTRDSVSSSTSNAAGTRRARRRRRNGLDAGT